MNLQTIQSYCNDGKLRWTKHILTRMTQRGINMSDVTTALLHGEIIEDYPDDYPDPSCLVLGFNDSKPIHVVCGVHDNELWLITAYIPDNNEWLDDYKTRKE